MGAGGGGAPIAGGGAVANMVWGRCLEAAGLLAASSLSAGVPCLSPLVSFLYAYDTVMARLHRYWPFIASMAASEPSNES